MLIDEKANYEVKGSFILLLQKLDNIYKQISTTISAIDKEAYYADNSQYNKEITLLEILNVYKNYLIGQIANYVDNQHVKITDKKLTNKSYIILTDNDKDKSFLIPCYFLKLLIKISYEHPQINDAIIGTMLDLYKNGNIQRL